jgi:hypothetical protein
MSATDTETYDAPFGWNHALRVIPLTKAGPMHIVDADWPVVAGALDRERGTAGSTDERVIWLKARRHADGRVIIYGSRVGPVTIRGGEIVPAGASLVVPILRLARWLDAPPHLANALADELKLVPRRGE